MTEQEQKVLDLLAEAWNEFVELPVLHHADRREFANAIHAAQNIVLSREGLRVLGIVRLTDDARVDEAPAAPEKMMSFTIPLPIYEHGMPPPPPPVPDHDPYFGLIAPQFMRPAPPSRLTRFVEGLEPDPPPRTINEGWDLIGGLLGLFRRGGKR